MIRVRRSDERGHAQHGWLDSYHTFSFADYYDPEHMGFRDLRVINEDRVQPGRGFGRHPHRDMEIVSYVVEGALEHADSLGTGSVIRAGDVQRMSAGSGVVHSEYNPSPTEEVRFLQIWILPERDGLPPSYDQRSFPTSAAEKVQLVVSPDGRAGSLAVHQDVRIFLARLGAGDSGEVDLGRGRYAWVQVVRGSVEANGESLAQGDGAALSGESAVRLRAAADSEALVFDLR